MMYNKIFKYGLGTILCMVFTFPALADPFDPTSEDDPVAPQAPIDNALMILVIAAIALGFYFLKKRKTKCLE